MKIDQNQQINHINSNFLWIKSTWVEKWEGPQQKRKKRKEKIQYNTRQSLKNWKVERVKNKQAKGQSWENFVVRWNRIWTLTSLLNWLGLLFLGIPENWDLYSWFGLKNESHKNKGAKALSPHKFYRRRSNRTCVITSWRIIIVSCSNIPTAVLRLSAYNICCLQVYIFLIL